MVTKVLLCTLCWRVNPIPCGLLYVWVCVCRERERERERESKWSMALDKSEYTVSFLLYIKKCVLILGDNIVWEACRARCKSYYCPSLCVEIDSPGDSVFWVGKWCRWQIDIFRGNKLFIPVCSQKINIICFLCTWKT